MGAEENMAGGYAGEEACHAGAMSSVSRLGVQRCPHLGLFRTAPHRHQNPLPFPLYTYDGQRREEEGNQGRGLVVYAFPSLTSVRSC